MGDLNSFTVVSSTLGTLKLRGLIDRLWRWVSAPVEFVFGNQLAVMLSIAGDRLAAACPPWPADGPPEDLPIGWTPEVER